MKNKIYKSGILLHPTALPGPWGMGELGPQAYKFVDDLVEMGQSYWQILPLGPLDNTFSPYSLLSTFAGNPLLISFDKLIEIELLKSDEELKNFLYPHISFRELTSTSPLLWFGKPKRVIPYEIIIRSFVLESSSDLIT